MPTHFSDTVVAHFTDDDNPFLDVPRQITPSDCEAWTDAEMAYVEIVGPEMAKLRTQLRAKYEAEGFESYELTYDSDDDSDISLLPNCELQTLFD